MRDIPKIGANLMRFTRLLDPERAHRWTITALAGLPVARPPVVDARLTVKCMGLNFAHPVCLAAGFDKDGRAVHAMPRFGFAGAEAGTLTPLPQEGNPRPRLFRLSNDAAVINRMGFNNGGQQAAAPRLAKLYRRTQRGLVGINIGANKNSDDRIADYVTGVAAMAPHADWLTINISSPNTPGLRALQDEGALDDLLSAIAAARPADGPPLCLKVAPDLDNQQIDGIVRSAINYGIDAIIIGNTTLSRPPMSSRDAGEGGGLSGAPLAELALAKLKAFRSATGGQIPLIAAGGIATADDVWQRMRAGASLVQLYSALVYAGPWLARQIVDDLLAMVEDRGLTSLSQIIDADALAD